ncbi:hypothetical protein ACU4GD_32600 [Cupriavidus basilensis]
MQSLQKLSTEEVRVQIVHRRRGRHLGVGRQPGHGFEGGRLSASTCVPMLARASWPRTTASISRYYNIIYDAVDEIKAAMSGMLAPEKREVTLGTVEVRQVFRVPKIGAVAGCMVTDGMVKRTAWCGCCVTTWSSIPASSIRSSASRTTSRKSSKASSAVCRSRTSTTFRKATSSKCMKSPRWRARCKACCGRRANWPAAALSTEAY